MKILFVVPNRGLGYPRIFKRIFHIPNLTARTLASITSPEHQFTAIDESIERVGDHYYEKVEANIVAISVHTHNAVRAYEIAAIVRNRKIPVVMGGIHVSSLPDEALRYCDAVIVGEAENRWNELLQDFSIGQNKKIYKSNDYYIMENSQDIISDTSTTSLLKINSIQTSRGCPFKCKFCSVSAFFGNSLRYKPVSLVIEEIKRAKCKYNFFVDDNIVASKGYAKELFSELRNLNIKWASQAPVSIANNEELLCLAKDSGCCGLMIGFDSISKQSLNNIGKKQNNVDNYCSYVQKIKATGIPVVGSFIFGFDCDDISVFESTLNFAKLMEIDLAYFFILTPYPGTELFLKLTEEGRIFERDWSKFDCNHVVFQPRKMEVYDLQQGFEWAWNEFYSLKNTVARILKTPGAPMFFANAFYLFGRRYFQMEKRPFGFSVLNKKSILIGRNKWLSRTT